MSKRKGPNAYPIFDAKTWRGDLIRWSKQRGWPVIEVFDTVPVGKGHVQVKVRVQMETGEKSV